MTDIIISNTCVGQYVMHKFGFLPYNNPFVGTLIINDTDYIKMINNFSYYVNTEPILGKPKENTLFSIQNNQSYYKHPTIELPYPVIYLDDIEIHCIHESNNEICLEKFKRRQKRLLECLNNNPKIFFLMSFSEFINEHDDYDYMIRTFYEDNIKSNLKINKIFIGPKKYNRNYSNYINIDEWDDVSLERDQSNILKINNQPFISKKFYELIKNI